MKGKKIILFVGHGSRGPGGNEEIAQFVAEFKVQNPTLAIELCYIEFAEVLLNAGLKTAASGANKVVVIPLILNAAGHVKMEIPHAIAEVREEFPQVEFILAKHIGATSKVLDIVSRQITKVANQLLVPDPQTTGVILLGRGSSDMVANGEVAKMARWIMEKTDYIQVDTAFTGITFPRLEKVIQAQVKLGMTQIIVQPYYLFNGRLIERIKGQVERLRIAYPTITIGLGQYFGFEKEIYQIIKTRLNEATMSTNQSMMECDGCGYRLEAEKEPHHHHHH